MKDITSTAKGVLFIIGLVMLGSLAASVWTGKEDYVGIVKDGMIGLFAMMAATRRNQEVTVTNPPSDPVNTTEQK